ncbi:hypothetical protein NG895_02115 [Aeoliella sp. ICT_H6.2]|uniref:DNA methylase n=1 Tax=Aeoliella straminimaris TaxID=2954799 RepID=A0A9X2FEP6_9BACT|nr:hypothetical protein [Aeoliella straminimaris]MCO6042691.1 hypothetical protein [Aeoliella straminimaris]
MPTINVPLAIPETTSPVPTLASVHVEGGRGDYGDPNYRGNCSGLLIRDLVAYFRPRNLLDPMQGGGTAGDVARSLGIDYQGFDLKTGFDAADARSFDGLGGFDMVWLHPPYHDLIRYSDDPRCLSRSSSLTEFCDKLAGVLANCRDVLTQRGHLVVLMGDITRRGNYYALPFHAWRLATELGMELACPEIVRLSHGATSTARTYRFSFIPRVHDVCLVLRRRASKTAPVAQQQGGAI